MCFSQMIWKSNCCLLFCSVFHPKLWTCVNSNVSSLVSWKDSLMFIWASHSPWSDPVWVAPLPCSGRWCKKGLKCWGCALLRSPPGASTGGCGESENKQASLLSVEAPLQKCRLVFFSCLSASAWDFICSFPSPKGITAP